MNMKTHGIKNLPGLFALVWVVFIFFQYVNNHKTYAKAFNLLDSTILPLLILFFLALLAYSLGRTLIRFLSRIEMEPMASFLVSSAMGFMIFAFGTAILAFIHLLTKPAVIFLLILLGILSYKDLIRAIKSLKIRIPSLSSLFDVTLVFILVLFILMNLLFALAPPSGLDEQQYHLNVPQTYIRNHGFVIIENMGEQAKFPQNVEMLYAFAMLLHSDILAKLINFYFGVLCLALIWAFVKKFFTFNALLPCAFFYCSWLVYYISSRANVDLGLAFFEGVMIFSLLIWRDGCSRSEKNLRRNYYFYFSAVCAGFSLGVKYTTLFGIMGIIGVFFFYGIGEWKNKWKAWISSLFIYGAVALAVFSPWMIKNTLLYGMPFAPYRISNHLRLAAGIKTQTGNATDAKSPIAQLRERNALLYKGAYPRSSFLDFLLIPYNATIYGDWPMQVFDTLAAPFYLMFFPFIFFFRKKPEHVKTLLFYALIVYCQWHVMQPITRYLTPVLLLMTILLAYVIHRLELIDHILMAYAMKALKGIILIMLLITLASQILIFASINPLYYLMGFETKSSYLSRANPAGIQPVIDYINENLPQESRILLLWEKRGYYIRRDYQEDASGNIFALAMLKFENPKEASIELKKMGYTHILADLNLPGKWFGSGYKKGSENQKLRQLGNKELEFFLTMAQENLCLLKKAGSMYLYRID
ncbi:hypothetical protein JW926_00485 [Candidatus Sumerlaeota bacterium]|nr:hypothetical protein [Candidatus Sumerlaeota bacterium]